MLAPENAFYHFRLGGVLGEKGYELKNGRLIKRGVDECHLAFALDPTLGTAMQEVAVLLHNAGHFEEALHASDQAMPTHAESAHFWYCRANNLRCLERWVEAELAYRRASELTAGGEHIEAMVFQFAILDRLGRRKDALNLARRIENRAHTDPRGAVDLLERPKRIDLR